MISKLSDSSKRDSEISVVISLETFEDEEQEFSYADTIYKYLSDQESLSDFSSEIPILSEPQALTFNETVGDRYVETEDIFIDDQQSEEERNNDSPSIPPANNTAIVVIVIVIGGIGILSATIVLVLKLEGVFIQTSL